MKSKGLIIFGIHVTLILGIAITCGILTNSPEELGESNKFNVDDEGNLILEHSAKLQILENDTAIKQGYLKELLLAFNQEYAEYGIVAVDANMDQYSDLEQDGPYGYGPDVLYQANDRIMNYVDGRHIQPIPNELIDDYTYYPQAAWDAFQRNINGASYTFAVPVNIQGALLYYRKDLLPQDWRTTWDDNHNDIPDMLESWNAMYKYSALLANDDNTKTWGYMRSFMEPYFSAGYLFSYGGYAFGDNNTNVGDIGFSAGEAYKGASIVRQLASLMDERCIDDTVTVTAYKKLAEGEFFATITTPDVYTLFVEEIKREYGATVNIDDYLGVSDIPQLPQSGDLNESNPTLIPTKMMGGIHGYAISSYTKYPNASLAFINFATKYEMIQKRNELLGIAPARIDVAQAVGGLSEIINENMANGDISIMPSIKAVGQIWTPLQTLFQDIAKDPFRMTYEMKYLTADDFKRALEKVDQQIYDAIHILQ